MTIAYRLSPPLTNVQMNALFSVGWPRWQNAPDTSDWQPVLAKSLVYVAAFDGEHFIGFVNIAWDGRDHAFLIDTRVDPAYRRRGIGRELVARASAAAREAGCTRVHVDYTDDLDPFYTACGFVHTTAGLLAL